MHDAARNDARQDAARHEAATAAAQAAVLPVCVPDFNRGLLWRPVLSVTVASVAGQVAPSTCQAAGRLAVASDAGLSVSSAGHAAGLIAARCDPACERVAAAAAALAGASPGSYGCQADITWLRAGSEDGQVSGTFHVQRSNFLFIGKKRLQRPDSTVILKVQTASPELHEGASVRLHFVNDLSCIIKLQGAYEAEKLRDECAAVHDNSRGSGANHFTSMASAANDAATSTSNALAGTARTTPERGDAERGTAASHKPFVAD